MRSVTAEATPEPTEPEPTDSEPADLDRSEPRSEAKSEGVYARRTRIRKQEILESALVAFGQKGFYKASLADVASAAGITAAGLLHHFKTKEALLIELLQQRDLVDIQQSPGGEYPHGRAFLQLLVDTMSRNMTRTVTTQMYAVLSAEGVTEAHPARRWFLERYRGLRLLISTALTDAIADGDIPADIEVDTTAAAIIAVMDGLQIQWLYEPEAVDMAEVTCQVITALARPVVPLVPRRATSPSA
jgi:AcrR family transcriptional regulator